MTEKPVEEHLKKRVKELGGRAMKFVSPSFRGRPDQIVLLYGLLVFVEVKKDTGELSPLQVHEISKLEKHGANVTVVYGKTGVDAFIEDLISRDVYELHPIEFKGEYR